MVIPGLFMLRRNKVLTIPTLNQEQEIVTKVTRNTEMPAFRNLMELIFTHIIWEGLN